MSAGKKKSKLMCMTTECKSFSWKFNRNCNEWRPHVSCGFKDLSEVVKEKNEKCAERINWFLNKIGDREQSDLWFGTPNYHQVEPEDEGDQQGNAMDTQVGGGHYKDMAIQPTEYNQKNNLGWCEGNIVKYASRHQHKNGLEDVKKIKHYAEMLAFLAYGEEI